MQERLAQNEKVEIGKRLINFRTLLFCALFLSLGVLFAYLYLVVGAPFWLVFCIIPLTGLICMLAFTLVQWKRICVSLALLILAFSLGAGAFALQMNAYQKTTQYNGEYTVIGRVVEKETDGSSYLLIMDNLSVSGEKAKGTLTAYVSKSTYENITRAQELVLRGNLQTKTELLGDYGFRAYAVEENARYIMNVDGCQVVNSRFNVFLAIRNRFERVLFAGMDETPASVMFATLTGNTSLIEEGLLGNIRRGGIAHIFAVSGLHVGALYGFCLLLISKTKLRKTPKIVRFFIVLFTLVFYGGICGYSSSVIRAIVMCMLFYLTKLTGFVNDGLETVSLSMIIVLLLSPTSLFTVGFQLSFSACYGIILLSRPLTKAFYKAGDFIKYDICRKKRKPFVLEENTHPLNNWQRLARLVVGFLSVTISAQIATTPIQIASFGYFSPWSFLLNCLFVPMISVAFSVLLAFCVVASCLPIVCSKVVLFVPNTVWSTLLLAFESTFFSAWEIASFPIGAFVAYYFSVALCSGRWNIPKWILIVFAILFAIACACILVFANAT